MIPEPVETYEHAGFTIQILPDDGYQSEWALEGSRVGTIVIEHRDYQLGDEHALPDFQRDCEQCKGTGIVTVAHLAVTLDTTDAPCTNHALAKLVLSRVDTPISRAMLKEPNCPTCGGAGYVKETPFEFYRRTESARVVIPIGVYRDWNPSLYIAGDIGQADGFAYDTPAAVKEVLGEDVTDGRIRKVLLEEVRDYSDAIHGDVYRFRILDGAGREVEDAGYGGIIGSDLTYVKSEAEGAAVAAARALEAERREAFEMACRDIPTA